MKTRVHFARLFIAAAMAASPLCAAEPLSMWIGQTKTMTLSVQVDFAAVADEGVVEIRTLEHGVELSGKAAGKTTLHVHTRSGDDFEFPVHVVLDGVVYSVGGGSAVPETLRASASLRPAGS